MCFSSLRFWSWPGLLRGTISIVSRCYRQANPSAGSHCGWPAGRRRPHGVAHSEGPLVMPIKVRLTTLNVKLITHFLLSFLVSFCSLEYLFPPFSQELFRVRFQDPSQGQSHTLQVNDIFHKQQWLNCLHTAMSTQKDLPLPESESLSTLPVPTFAPNGARLPSPPSSIWKRWMRTVHGCGLCSFIPSSEEPPSPRPPQPSTLSSSSSSSSISAPFLPRKSKKEQAFNLLVGKRKETMV